MLLACVAATTQRGAHGVAETAVAAASKVGSTESEGYGKAAGTVAGKEEDTTVAGSEDMEAS